ncbi:MAG: hypothetical protein LBL69_02230 [Zoogloeaceae bacterium]|jgi:hypothetical protein|nr:hypothetical protein [Zoogloeaceae bacterium]
MKIPHFSTFSACFFLAALPAVAEEPGQAPEAIDAKDFQSESFKSCQTELTDKGFEAAKATAYCHCYIEQVAKTLSPADIEAMNAAEATADAGALIGDEKLAALRDSATQCLSLLK